MRWLIAGVVLAMPCGARAFAGTVTFSPEVLPLWGGWTGRFTITLQATGEVDTISGADVVIVTDANPDFFDYEFAYSDEWLAAMEVVTPLTESVDFYPWGILVGGASADVGVGRSIVLGTLSITDLGIAAEADRIFVSGEIDGLSTLFRGLPGQEFVSEPLNGAGWIAFGVPEPGTACLLSVAALGLIQAGRRSFRRLSPRY